MESRGDGRLPRDPSKVFNLHKPAEKNLFLRNVLGEGKITVSDNGFF